MSVDDEYVYDSEEYKEGLSDWLNYTDHMDEYIYKRIIFPYENLINNASENKDVFNDPKIFKIMLTSAVRRAILFERKECARACELTEYTTQERQEMAEYCAEVIRNRKSN